MPEIRSLRELSARVLNSRNGLQLQTIERDAIIREYRAAGVSLRAIAEDSGLSIAQVQRICDLSKDRSE